MPLLGLIVVIILIGLLVWAATRILAVIPVAEPFKTIAYVLIVVVSVLIALSYLGLVPGEAGCGIGLRLR